VTATPATRTGQVHDMLRSELLNGVLPPGQKLTMAGLTERFGVSQSVIREALTRLTEQGLLVATPQRGFRVRGLSIRDIAELTETRVQAESLAIRLAVQRGDLRWETGILAAHHRLERTPVTRDDGTVSEDWSVRHRDFHRALLAGCGNRRLESVASSLRDSAELYRRWYCRCWAGQNPCPGRGQLRQGPLRASGPPPAGCPYCGVRRLRSIAAERRHGPSAGRAV
jgi:DNA-binding GntR family transcriptional regulator